MQRIVKRLLDVVLAAVLLVLLSPLLIACIALILIVSGRPAIFAQEREGKGLRAFTLYKLRTMVVDADAQLAAHLATNIAAQREWEEYRRLDRDPRIIPGIGRLLRQSSIDELPQLWNVLRGDMSLVGPRPLELDIADRLPADIRNRRASIRPGVTGLWQVSGRSELDIATMVRIDDEYLRHWRLGKDVAILARTPLTVLFRRGAY